MGVTNDVANASIALSILTIQIEVMSGEKDRTIGIPDHVVGALRLWKQSNLD